MSNFNFAENTLLAQAQTEEAESSPTVIDGDFMMSIYYGIGIFAVVMGAGLFLWIAMKPYFYNWRNR